jgi:hypothetical protein
MAVRLFCDWNSHKKGEIVYPQQSHEIELIKLGYAGIVSSEIIFNLKEVSQANKESEHLWNSQKESV